MPWDEVSYLAMRYVKRMPELTGPSSLARSELYMTLATVFRRFENQELFETTRSDVVVKHDYLLPQTDEKSKGVRVLFR